ncbi:uncharacterized protein C20orf96 homolog isoform X3 [Erinaceus europaeus]|nr:uncharacterized protein C20orf96 homolog isoform X3 [Erinaceus europaeus]
MAARSDSRQKKLRGLGSRNSKGLELYTLRSLVPLSSISHTLSGNYGKGSTVYSGQNLDYVPWQRTKQKIKSSSLPSIQNGYKKSNMKTLTNFQAGLNSRPTMLATNQQRNAREPNRGKLDPGKTQAKIRLMRCMVRSRRTSFQELCNHEQLLIRLSEDLVKDIQDIEDSSALKVREMLQHQDILATIMDILEYSNKKKLEELTAEFEDWKEKEESKMKYLEQQLEQLNAKIQKTQEEVNFLSTYMDHEYPVKSVQISTLARKLQQIKDRQQDELDDLSEMRRKVLGSVSRQIHMKKQRRLNFVVEKALAPHQEALLQRTRDTQYLLEHTKRFREIVDRFEKEIPVLKASVEQLEVQVMDPREVIFADVLLRRPK